MEGRTGFRGCFVRLGAHEGARVGLQHHGTKAEGRKGDVLERGFSGVAFA